jgi:hypothetical protein
MDIFFQIFLGNWGPPCQDYQSALNNLLEDKEDEVPKTMETVSSPIDENLGYQDNKEDEVVQTIEVEETSTFPICEDL